MGSGESKIYTNTRGSESKDKPSSPSKTRSERHGTDSELEESYFNPSTSELEKQFNLNEHGHFGRKGNGRRVRVVESSDPVADARAMYEELSKGGCEKLLPNGKGIKTEFDDGTTIVFREITSTSNSPAVEIQDSASPFIQDQKVHFIMGE